MILGRSVSFYAPPRFCRNAVNILRRDFALGENPKAPQPYVTWACYDDTVSGKREYEWGHYGSDYNAAFADLVHRVRDYQRQFKVEVLHTEAPGLYKYYSTQRPVDIGTFPKPSQNAPDEIKNYDKRVPVEGGAFMAWGYLTYTRPLTEQDIYNYELRPSKDNPRLPDRKQPIAEQLKTAQRQAEKQPDRSVTGKDAPSLGEDR